MILIIARIKKESIISTKICCKFPFERARWKIFFWKLCFSCIVDEFTKILLLTKTSRFYIANFSFPFHLKNKWRLLNFVGCIKRWVYIILINFLSSRGFYSFSVETFFRNFLEPSLLVLKTAERKYIYNGCNLTMVEVMSGKSKIYLSKIPEGSVNFIFLKK